MDWAGIEKKILHHLIIIKSYTDFEILKGVTKKLAWNTQINIEMARQEVQIVPRTFSFWIWILYLCHYWTRLQI